MVWEESHTLSLTGLSSLCHEGGVNKAISSTPSNVKVRKYVSYSGLNFRYSVLEKSKSVLALGPQY